MDFTQTKTLACANCSVSPHALMLTCTDKSCVYGPYNRGGQVMTNSANDRLYYTVQ